MIGFASLLLAQIVVPNGAGLSVEQKVDVLANDTVRGAPSLLMLFGDTSVRERMKRVGLDAGCPVATSVVGETARRFRQEFLPYAARAVREVIPPPRLEALRPVSLSIGYGGLYRSRVEEKFEELAAEPLGRARSEASKEAVAALLALPTYSAPGKARPAEDRALEQAFAARPGDVWNSAPLMSIACLQRNVPKGVTLQFGGRTYSAAGDQK